MDREALVLPGGANGPNAPLLMYAADAAEARGARIRRWVWNPPFDPSVLHPDDASPWVTAQLGPVAGRPLLIGKSLGTHAATIAAESALPAVWLTPILTADSVVEALRHKTAPALLIGGTADPMWQGSLARELSDHVLEVDGADHGMYVPGRLAAFAAVLGRVATAVEDFLDEVVWHTR